MSIFSNRLSKTREARGMSASDLARLMGVTATAVWNWEKNGVNPRPETLTLLARVLGVSEDYLLGRSSDESRNRSIPDILKGAQENIALAAGVDPKKVSVKFEIGTD